MKNIDTETVRDWALGTVAEWLPGYTEVRPPENTQCKITDVTGDRLGDRLVMRVQKADPDDGYSLDDGQVFEIDVKVRELPAAYGREMT